tara:strand:- start:188 stop:3538 length:3351 start_codon:yes stop_codon:yes gene_type:complete
MTKLSAVVIVVLFSLSLFTSMIGNNIQLNDNVLTESEDVFETHDGHNHAIGCQGSTTHYVELKGHRWFDIGPLEGHADSWFEYRSMELLRLGDEKLSFDLFTGCLYLGESYMVEWNLTMDSQIVDSGLFLWAQTQELQQFRVETNITYPDAVVDEYILSASIKEWHRPTASYVSGQGFTHTVEMPYSDVLVEDIDETECSQNANKTLHYEVLYNRVFEPGDFFVGGIQVICPLFDTEYSIEFWFGHESGSADYFGSIPFNFSSTDNDYESYPIFEVLESDGYQLNVTGEWHFYATLNTYNDTFGGFYDIVGPDTSKDIRDLFFVNQTDPVLESLEDTDGVPYFLDLCLFTPWQAWGNVSESGCDETYNQDVDFDGVPNKFDLCPDTEYNSSVDLYGCSPNYNLDSDGDSFIDRYDRFPSDVTQWADSDNDGFGDNLTGSNPDDCPMQSGNSTVDRIGCPDQDGDGISDADGLWNVSQGADACPELRGNSTVDRVGCPDYDRDGYSDPDDIWNISSGADAFPIEPTQWNDTDGDGYGDNLSGYQGDLWPNNASKCCDVDVDGYDDFYEDACPDEYGNSTTDRIGCIDTDGDGFSDKYDADPNDPNVMTIGSFTRNKVGDEPRMSSGVASYGSGDMSVDENAGFIGLIYTSGLREITVKRYDGSTNEWKSITQDIPWWSDADWRTDPAHIPVKVDDSGTLHYVIDDTYYQWDGETKSSHTFSVRDDWSNLESDLDIEGDHIHVTRMDESIFIGCGEYVGNRQPPKLYYDHSSDGGKTWASTITKSASGLTGHSVAAGKNGDAHIVYTIMKQGAIKNCNYASLDDLMTLTSSSGLYYMEVKDGATWWSSNEKLTNSSQRFISRDPHIEFHSSTDSVYILVGEISLNVKQVTRITPFGEVITYPPIENINANGLHFFGKCDGDTCSSTYPVNTWYSQKIANGHAGSSYDLEVSEAGVPHAVYKSTRSQVAYVSISGYDFSTTPPTIEWETRFISGTVVSGVGLTLYDESPIIIGAGKVWVGGWERWNYNVYLYSWDDDGDGLSNWEDYCPYAFGLSTDETQGCPDADGDGKTDQVEGTEDESGDSGVFGLPSLSLFSTLMMAVVAAASIHRRDQKKDEDK